MPRKLWQLGQCMTMNWISSPVAVLLRFVSDIISALGAWLRN